MIKTILRIYDYMRSHSKLCVLSFCITTALLTGLVSKIQFNEDISAFLPLGEQYQESLQVYQDVSGASKLLAVFIQFIKQNIFQGVVGHIEKHQRA